MNAASGIGSWFLGVRDAKTRISILCSGDQRSGGSIKKITQAAQKDSDARRAKAG
jgi:hypothetical protein